MQTGDYVMDQKSSTSDRRIAIAEAVRKEGVTRAIFESVLPDICRRDTSSNPDGWTEKNPLQGHCAVVSVLAQDMWEGKLLRASLENDAEFKFMGSHYINRLGDGTEVDFTRAQFGDRYPKMVFEERTKDYVLVDPKTKEPRPTMDRYKTLAYRFMTTVAGENVLFEDKIYKECFSAAMESSCQKMNFGSVIMHGQEIVYSGANVTIPPLKFMCEGECIRNNIQSRTESMIGACGHAEELGLWTVAKKGIKLSECDLYVAGFNRDKRPYIKKAAEHTCLRCAVQMYNAEIRQIYVPVKDHWEGISAETAVNTAALYATGNKKV